MNAFFTALTFFTASGSNAAQPEVKTLKTPAPLYSLNRTNLYAIGKTETGDAITVLNGNIHVAKATAKIPLQEVASELTFANVVLWNEVPLPKDVTDSEKLHELINKTLREQGYELPRTTPFLLKGKFTLAGKKTEGMILGYFTKAAAENSAPAFRSVMHFVGKQTAVAENLGLQGQDRPTLYIPR